MPINIVLKKNMRHIVKRGPPRGLTDWIKDNSDVPENLVYNKAQFPLSEVRESLMAEQFHLCAYTIRKLPLKEDCVDRDTGYSCHIEHWLPQNRKVKGEDIDYTNMLACFPSSKSKFKCDYGAHRKDFYDPGAQDEKPLISPLQARVTKSFKYRLNGTVEGTTVEARTTIDILNLNAKSLVNDRRAVIEGWLEPRGKRVSPSHARRVIQELSMPDAHNCLEEFCKAIMDVAEQIASTDEKRAQRTKGTVRQ